MQAIYVDSKKLKAPLSMNGKFKAGTRFEVTFVPGKETQLNDREYSALSEDESFVFLVDSGCLVKKESKVDKKTPAVIAEEELVKAEKALELASTKEEQKAANALVKEAKEKLKQAEKAEKKGK